MKTHSQPVSHRLLVGALLLDLLCPPNAWSWGRTGHAVVADIAEAHLTPAAAAEIHRLLAVEGAHHLSDVSLWADSVKGTDGSPSHTIRLPIDGSAPGPHPCPGHFCADDGLIRYGAVLADRTRPDAEREIALKYIVHLVGDLHQPLHGTNATGGTPVLFGGKQMSIHGVWDDGIIDEHGGTHQQIAVALIGAEHGVPSGGTPLDWAREDLVIDQQQIYDLVPLHSTSPFPLPDNYAEIKWPIVQLRLTEGGLRLAQLLNSLLK